MRSWILVVIALLVGCTHDIRAVYPTEPGQPTGRLVLILTQAADVTLSVNGLLVLDGEHTRKITIDNIPTGNAEITLAANGGDKQFRAWVDSERPTTVPLGVPSENGSFLKTLAGSLITLVAYSLLH